MNKEEFIKELKNINIEISEEELNKFDKYKELLKEYNEKFNLTAIIKDEDIYLKHFYDSLCLLKVPELHNTNNILDIGTGAGFPGIPLAIMLPKNNITLVESNEKKCMFLKVVCDELDLKNVSIVNDRAENYAKTHRESFDIATSRAVSALKVLLELEIPTLKINGYFLPLKSHIEDEISDSKEILNELNCTIEEVISYARPIENSERTILKIKKNKETNIKYPREYNKIIKDLKKNKN